MPIVIRNMLFTDSPMIADSFRDQGWNKPVEQYEQYFRSLSFGLNSAVQMPDGTYAIGGSLNVNYYGHAYVAVIDQNLLSRQDGCL